MKIALTIAGADSCGGAGATLDLRVFHACGVYGVSALTALTAQNTRGVERIHPVPPRFLAAQLDALARDLPIAAVKTGMLARSQVVTAAADRIRRRSLPNVVVDPVLLAKDGTPLLSARGIEALKSRLLPLALVVTPNVPEAERLAGIAISDSASLREAARRIAALGPRGVVIKGGHLPGEPVDTLFWEGEFLELAGERRDEGPPVHGTGCCFAAALAAHLARGSSVPEACRAAKRFVERAMAAAASLGRGSRLFTRFPTFDCDAE